MEIDFSLFLRYEVPSVRINRRCFFVGGRPREEEGAMFCIGLLRYVYQNPVKAGVCKSVEDYRSSSDWSKRENKLFGAIWAL
jgi:hypothetical protein